MRPVFIIGLGVCFVAGLLLFGFKDKACLGKESEAIEGEEIGTSTSATKWIPIFNIMSLLVIMCGAGIFSSTTEHVYKSEKCSLYSD